MQNEFSIAATSALPRDQQLLALEAELKTLRGPLTGEDQEKARQLETVVLNGITAAFEVTGRLASPNWDYGDRYAQTLLDVAKNTGVPKDTIKFLLDHGALTQGQKVIRVQEILRQMSSLQSINQPIRALIERACPSLSNSDTPIGDFSQSPARPSGLSGTTGTTREQALTC